MFDTNFAADLTILEEGTELLTRLRRALVDKQPVALPMFTSCSPGWIKFMEYFHPDMLPNLSTCKSPQQMFGAVAKTYYAEKLGKRPEQIFVVSIMPCTAKKFECQRPEMDASGVRDVDVVLTTRELGKMIRAAGIDFDSLPDEEMDAPLGLSTGAADIFANTGGVMEAALRTAYEIVTGRELPMDNLHVAPVAGLAGVKEASLTIEKPLPEWKFLEGVHAQRGRGPRAGQRPAGDRRRSSAGEKQYHFVEVMTCPGGCIGGGGQPRFTDNQVREARIAAIYREDEGKKLRKSHENPDVAKLYEEFLGQPLGEKSHHLLHTKYTRAVRCRTGRQAGGSEAGGWRLEAGGWRLEAGGCEDVRDAEARAGLGRLEAGGWRLEAGGWRRPQAPAATSLSMVTRARFAAEHRTPEHRTSNIEGKRRRSLHFAARSSLFDILRFRYPECAPFPVDACEETVWSLMVGTNAHENGLPPGACRPPAFSLRLPPPPPPPGQLAIGGERGGKGFQRARRCPAYRRSSTRNS